MKTSYISFAYGWLLLINSRWHLTMSWDMTSWALPLAVEIDPSVRSYTLQILCVEFELLGPG